MKHFKELTEKQALKYVSNKQYNKILKGSALHDVKFLLWIGLVDDRIINPIDTPLPNFYK